MKKIYMFWMLVLSLGTGISMGQPTWSVTAADYQYSANITGQIFIDGTAFRNSGGILGAFVAGQCRGVASPQYNSQIDKYLIFLTIFSNNATGDQVSFQFYNNEIDFIHGVNNSTVFTVDMTLGGIDNPYVFDVIPANNNKQLTVTPGFSNIVKEITTNSITVANNSTTSQLQAALTPPKDGNGNIVGSFIIRYIASGLAVPLDATLITETMEVRVTAQDLTEKTYSIFLGNSDATLSSLTISNGTLTPTFSSNVTSYVVTLPFGSGIPEVSAVCNDPNATRNITQAASIPGTASVSVTAEDGVTTKSYQISIAYLPNTDAKLKELSVSEGSLAPAFDPEVLNYQVDLPWNSASVPGVTAISNDGNATMVMTNATSLPGTTTIIVTAEDQSTVRTYSIDFTLLPNTDAKLSSLTISKGSLSPSFSPETHDYLTSFAPGTTEVPVVNAIANDGENASVNVDYPAILPGQILITVTAMDAVTTESYRIEIQWTGNQESRLASILINNAPLSGFVPESRSYNYVLPIGFEGIPTVQATTTDPLGRYDVELPTQVPGDVVITAYAENFSFFRTYEIHLLLNSQDATLCEIKVDGTGIPGFNPFTLNYEFGIPMGISIIPVISAICTNPIALITINQATSVRGEAIIQVSSSDLSVNQEYRIKFVNVSGLDHFNWNPSDLKVFPNPSSGAVQVDINFAYPEDIELIVMDTQGKVVFRKLHHQRMRLSERLNLRVPSGVYYLYMKGSSDYLMRKILIL